MNFGRNLSWLAITATVGLGLFAAMGTQGCTITTGGVPDDDGGFDFDSARPDAGGDTSPGVDSAVPLNPCNECLFPHCAGQYAVCVQDTDCQKIYACATAPGCDSNCVQACYDNGTANAKLQYLAYASCDLEWSCKDCGTACNTPASACVPEDAGQQADTAPPPDAAPPPSKCDQCITDNCSAEKAACPAGSECDVYTACLGACNDATCIARCSSDHTSGAAAAAALANCTSTNCKTSCNY